MKHEEGLDPETRYRELTIQHNKLCHEYECLHESRRLERERLADQIGGLAAEIFYLRRKLIKEQE
jgi:hypothetical protein